MIRAYGTHDSKPRALSLPRNTPHALNFGSQCPSLNFDAQCSNRVAPLFAHCKFLSCMYLNVRFVVMQYGTSFTRLTCTNVRDKSKGAGQTK